MSHKNLKKTKLVVGAALVALSGFVPQPLIDSAHAATATTNVTGSFITGIQLTAVTSAKFAKLAATDINGSAVLSTAGAVTPSKAVTAGGAPQAGSFNFKAVSTTPNVDITVSGLGAVTLAATTGGAGPTGTVKLAKVILDNIGTASQALSSGGGTTAKKAGYDINTTSAVLKVGAQLTWGAVQPIGAFTQPIVLTISY